MAKQTGGTEGFSIDPKTGRKTDHDFHRDIFEYEHPIEVQEMGISDMRQSGHYSEPTIKECYPDAYFPPSRADRLKNLNGKA